MKYSFYERMINLSCSQQFEKHAIFNSKIDSHSLSWGMRQPRVQWPKVLGLIVLNILLISQLCTAQWFLAGTANNAGVVRGIYFQNVDSGYAVGANGGIGRTTDHGQSWTTQFSGTTVLLRSVQFINNDTGFVCGEAVDGYGTVLKTTDGGTTWLSSNSGVTAYCRAVDFTSASTGFLAGGGGLIFKTIDGGSSWSTYNLGVGSDVIQLDMVDSNTGYAVACDGGLVNGYIFKTSDGGDTWSQVYYDQNIGLLALAVFGENVVYAGGINQTIVKSTDGGATWSTSYSGSGESFRGGFAVSEDEIYMVGDLNSVLHTTNGGSSWQISIAGIGGLWCVYFPTPDAGYAGDGVGNVYRTCIPGEPATYYADADGDGFGSETDSLINSTCDPPNGYISTGSDCNDADPSVNPYGYDWDSDGIDQNCDGCVDGYLFEMYPDADGDGSGELNSSVVLVCYGIYGAPGYAFDNLDCNDADASISPWASDWDNNSIDNNCDGCIDGYANWLYPDADGDGWGNGSSDPVWGCYGPSGSSVAGYAPNIPDCDDEDPSINAGAYDWDANGIDNNCDGCVDGYLFWLYPDADGDGYGDVNDPGSNVCYGTPGYGWYGDCDDSDPLINPYALEDCFNGIDNNCNGIIDDGIFTTLYADTDNDGYGDSNNGIYACVGTEGYSINGGDCNDNDASVYPGATEICGNGVDENCDGFDVEITFYADADGDGYGDASVTAIDCNAPVGYVLNSDDCNDEDANINPVAYDYNDGNGIDNNCDGCVDGYANLLYQDADGDGWGDASSGGLLLCFDSTGYVTNNLDCNDSDPAINPWAYDGDSNGIDDNCDGCVDNYAYWLYPDGDGDGYGDPNATAVYICYGTPGYGWYGDCNDSDPSINPSAYDWDNNGVDNNCDGCVDGYANWLYPDADGDGWGDINGTALFTCSAVEGYGWYGDCNDADITINPGVYEDCFNGIDNNCNGVVDEGVFTTLYADADEDGYGDWNNSTYACVGTEGYSVNGGDCNDNDATVYPGATEICGNGIDENCDGIDVEATFYADADGDGYGDVNLSTTDCNQPVGYISNSDDCNDSDWSINPGAYDYDGNGIDNNCDGCVDGYGQYMWPDADGDGFGDAAASSVPICDGNTVGYAWNNQDCNDADPNINPWAYDWDSNGVDDNCDGCIDGYAYWLYPDADGDGYGANVPYTIFCSYPQPGYVFYNGDCNDADPIIYPGANEFDNGVDDNCDGQADEIQVCTPYIQWEHTWGGSNYDDARCRSIVQTSDGGYVVGGWSYSNSGDVTCSPYWGWITKSRSDGSLQWQSCINGYLNSIGKTTDGAYITSGTSFSTDFHLAKVDADGSVIWENDFGGSSSDYSYSGCNSNDGGYVAAGYTESNDGDVTNYHGSGDIWVIKVDAGGNLIWQRCLGGSSFEGANSVSPTADGGYLICGYTNSSDGDVSENHGNQDAWIVKLDGDGNLVWEKTIGTENWEYLEGGIATGDGGYALIGYTGSGNFTKLDADRNVQWSVWMPSYAHSIVQTTDNGYAVAGGIYSIHHNATTDMWAAKLQSNGTIQWSKSLGGNYYEEAYSIKQNSDGSYIVAGQTSSSDGDVSENKGDYDRWIVKLSEDPPSGLQTYYADADGDGYGNSTDSISDISCIAPPGYSYYNTDCNDADASVHPNAFEDCLNGIDDDCNGVIDDGTGDTPFYADVDGDGFGNVNAVVYDCSPPDGYVSNKDDCNDGNAAVHPGADEVCNGMDDNCNNQVDEGYTLYTFFADADGDTYGNHSAYIVSCDNVAPDGYVTDDSDCDDENAAVNPGATEIQNGLDDDCDGVVDEGFCSVPTGLFNDAVTTTSAHLHWTEPLNAKRYKIQYMPADGSTPPVNFTVLAPATYVNITGLSTFTLYKWRMKTRCNDGSSSVWTETMGFKTAPFKEGALEKSPAFDVKLYPNPTSGWVNVEVNAGTEQSVVIKFYDIVGKEVYSEEDGLQGGVFSRQIDLSFLSSGTYFLKVIHDGSNEVRKLVIEK